RQFGLNIGNPSSQIRCHFLSPESWKCIFEVCLVPVIFNGNGSRGNICNLCSERRPKREIRSLVPVRVRNVNVPNLPIRIGYCPTEVVGTSIHILYIWQSLEALVFS